ncbi:MAG: TraR/DksA family transcriptional regulator [Actinobacteria bacterium]|nr:TraR/DksA family transcriptional regulator [Actinomycetota bacterium]
MDYEDARKQLLSERARLERELDVFRKELELSLEEASGESPYGQHPAENATAAVDRQMDLTLEENLRFVLARIDHALDKLEAGTYGICDRCHGEIGVDRLEVAPYASLCVRCKQLEERSR